MTRVRLDTKERERIAEDALLLGGLQGKGALIQPIGEPANQVQPRLIRLEAYHVRQVSLCRLQQHCLALDIETAHTAQVAGEVALNDEIDQYRLFQRWRVDISISAGGEKWLDQLRRNDQIPHSQRRREHLTEGAKIEHA